MEADRTAPLAPIQSAMALAETFFPGQFLGPSFVLRAGRRIAGAVQPQLLFDAIDRVVRANDGLRSFPSEGHDRQLFVAAAESRARRVLRDDRSDPAPLATAIKALEATDIALDHPPLVTAFLSEIGEEDWLFGLVCHHFIMDQRAAIALISDVFAEYGSPGMATIRPQFSNYCASYADAESRNRERNVDFWRAQFRADPNLGIRPEEHLAGMAAGLQTQKLDRVLNGDLSRPKVEAAAQALDVTIAALLHAAFGLMKYILESNPKRDMSTTTIVLGGLADNADDSPIGPVLRTFPVILDGVPGPTLGELTREVQREWVRGWVHAELDFETLYAQAPDGPTWMADGVAVPTIFQVILSGQPAQSEGLMIEDVTLSEPAGSMAWGLEFVVKVSSDAMIVVVTRDGSRFPEARVELMIDLFERLLLMLSTDPNRDVEDALSKLLTTDTL